MKVYVLMLDMKEYGCTCECVCSACQWQFDRVFATKEAAEKEGRLMSSPMYGDGALGYKIEEITILE